MKITFFTLLIIISTELLGQNIYLEYSCKESVGISFYKAYVTEAFSVHSYEAQKQISNVTNYGESNSSFKPIFFKDKINNCLYFTAGLLGKYYYVKDSLHQMSWQLSKQTMEILGYKCKSATTTFRGRRYTAFYTEKIPVSEGVYKFGGLPGLILSVASDDGEYIWTVEKIIKNYKEDIEVKSIKSVLEKLGFVSWQEHKLRYKEEIHKMIANLKAKKTDNSFTVNFKIGGAEIIYPAAQTGEGIEY